MPDHNVNLRLKGPSPGRPEFDYLVEHEDSGVFTLTMHPQVIGRSHRMALLEHFIQHATQKAVRFARMGDVAWELDHIQKRAQMEA